MSQLIELEDKYFQDMLVQANRVASVVQDPALRKEAFTVTYSHLLELNSEHLDFDSDDDEAPEQEQPQIV